MKKRLFFTLISSVLSLLILSAQTTESKRDGRDTELIASWSFDNIQGPENDTKTIFTGYSISGNYSKVDGVLGEAMKFDGFTTQIRSNILNAEELKDGFSVESWVALATYPWNWCPVITQSDKERSGFYFGLGPQGEAGLFVSVNGSWEKCISSDKIILKEWTHIAATFNSKDGLKIYINGKLSTKLELKGELDIDSALEVLMGMNKEKVIPSHPVRTYATLPSWFSLDGICDEVKVYSGIRSEEDYQREASRLVSLAKPDIPERIMPSGPAGPGRFGAYYTKLKYYEEWDALWRVSDHSDIVIQFDDSPIRVVFWRGTRYSPAWVMENGQWMADQSGEYFDKLDGCFEHMIDPHCLYSHVRIIENTKARIVVHWRYIPVSVRKQFSQVDPVSGWQDCIDEYFTFYPDGVAVRKVIEHSTGKPIGPSESIVLCQPGTTPEDNVHLEAMTLVNMKGENHTYSWANGAPVFKKGENPPDPVIQIVNLKSENKPFTIFEPANKMSVFGGEQRYEVSHFPWWNHWPVAQNPSDGRYCQAPDRASHFSLAWGRPPYHVGENNTFWYTWLYGASTESPEKLAQLARSWNQAPEAIIEDEAVKTMGYDRSQRAYVFECIDQAGINKLDLKIMANDESPMVNGCFVLKNIDKDIKSIFSGKRELIRGSDYRAAIVRSLDGNQLIIWVNNIAKTTQKFSLKF